jgi:hypothetical protein
MTGRAYLGCGPSEALGDRLLDSTEEAVCFERSRTTSFFPTVCPQSVGVASAIMHAYYGGI